MPTGKLGKNETKAAQAAALKDLDSEMTEEERERILRRGMGVSTLGLQQGEDQLVEKKLTKEEKKKQTEERRAALAEKKAQMAAMKAAQDAARKQAAIRSGGGNAADAEDDGDDAAEDDGPTTSMGDSLPPPPLPEAPDGAADDGGAGDDGAGDGVATAPAATDAKPPKGSKGSHASKGGKRGGKAGVAAPAAKKTMPASVFEGVLVAGDDLPFFQRSGPAASRRKTMSLDIRIGGVRMCAGKQELLHEAVLALNYGYKYGLVGRNGVGKTTLLRHLADGRIALPPFISVVHVEQEIAGDERSAIDTIVQSDAEREWLLKAEEKLVEGDEATERALNITLGEVYERLEELDSDNAEARAAQLLCGLGFDVPMQQKPTREMSGGWRMRVALAQALFTKPDLLLLDEPTNHLDVHALTWLEFFLAAWERTVLIVSHDRGFLNKVTHATMFIHQKRLRYYGGNYDTFLKVRAENRAHNASMAKQNERRVNHLKSFIARFGHGAKNLARQAQSRMKMLQKLQDEPCEVDFDDPYLKLDFPCASPLPPPCISVNNAAFGYEPGKTLYRNCNFGVDCQSRVAIVGPNGAGKSTFLNLLTGAIDPTEGHVGRHAKLIIAKFTQHHIEQMDMEKSCVMHMRNLTREGVSIEEARRYLGRFGLTGDLALNPIGVLSGGQKSRLAFAELAWRAPHILLLDEPTNHLDLETIEALAMALNHFDGGVVFVTHDERLIEMVADELWVVNKGADGEPGSVTVWQGSYEAYKEKLQEEFVASGLVASGTVKGVK